MFANLTYQDKEAFFSLLDEYFASRPHLSQSSSSSAANQSPVQQLQSLGRFLSPGPASPSAQNSTSPASPPAPKTDAELAREAKEKERMDQVTKLAQRGLKTGTAGARSSIGMISRNTTAMNALDKYGAGGLVRSADGFMNKKKETPAGEDQVGSGKGSAPTPPVRKGGMSSFTSMFKEPKASTPITSTPAPTSASQTRTNLPPPPRRAPVEPEPETVSAESQAQAIYDYEGSDTGDLSVQNGQIVNVLEKTSDDYGNGRRGLVPANYLKEI